MITPKVTVTVALLSDTDNSIPSNMKIHWDETDDVTLQMQFPYRKISLSKADLKKISQMMGGDDGKSN